MAEDSIEKSADSDNFVEQLIEDPVKIGSREVKARKDKSQLEVEHYLLGTMLGRQGSVNSGCLVACRVRCNANGVAVPVMTEILVDAAFGLRVDSRVADGQQILDHLEPLHGILQNLLGSSSATRPATLLDLRPHMPCRRQDFSWC